MPDRRLMCGTEVQSRVPDPSPVSPFFALLDVDLLFVDSGVMDVIGTAADLVPETRMTAMLFQVTAEDQIRVLDEPGSADCDNIFASEQELRTAWQAAAPQKTPQAAVFPEGSKAARVCTLLSRPQGASLNEIRNEAGWQARTVRGFISRNLSKQGRKHERFSAAPKARSVAEVIAGLALV